MTTTPRRITLEPVVLDALRRLNAGETVVEYQAVSGEGVWFCMEGDTLVIRIRRKEEVA